MKITILDRADGEEDEIIIRCRQLDEHILKLVYALKAGQEKITAVRDGNIMQIAPKEIYYFEAWTIGFSFTLKKRFMRQSIDFTNWKNDSGEQTFSEYPNPTLLIWQRSVI